MLRAELLWSYGEELWSLYVPGHVTEAEFDAAARRLIKRYGHAREDLVPDYYAEDARGRLQRGRRDIKIQHLHMRIAREDGEMGEVHKLCKPGAKTGFPVTAMMF